MLTEILGPLQQAGQGRSSSRCFNCNREGHLSRKYRLPCRLCGAGEHRSNTCPRRFEETNQTQQPTRILQRERQTTEQADFQSGRQ
ncbi:hypothetical protein BDB00DRAFT_317286 [Zychaea mexicana]|uniref:uncharacterized protein n=1 Tax=Zychaea mexicana TaxID=64656 RepID=UPI0022FE0BC5|nr:uncharacterized protein BDB00DRAFT_317286 [Zychaea mexicana]KAI9494214.1 hypothetical protein BDB00DRAFT_317286 [Zychaea mexicana]